MADTALGIIIGLIFICLIVLFCVLLVKLYINKISAYNKVIYQKDLDFQKTLNSTIIETQEQVLNNISQDLHDDAGQQLTYINFQLENLKLDSPELHRLLNPVSESVSQLSASVRRISHSLNNQLLMQQDLIKAIAAETERLKQIGQPSVNLEIREIQPKTFNANEQIVLYRIFQELISNSLKHANATIISIGLKTDPAFSMEISDNGKGFDVEKAKVTTMSLGLKNIEQRAAIIGYFVTIESVPGKGTTVIVSEKQ